MTNSLIDSLNQLAAPDLPARVASSLGEPVRNVGAGLISGMAAMLVGILGKSSDSAAMQSLFSIVTNSANDGSVLDNPAALVDAAPGTPMASLSEQFLSSVFGERASTVTDALTKTTGLRPGSVSSLMQIAASLMLAVLGKRVRDGGLNAITFTRMFADERESIQRAVTAEIASALGVSARAPARLEYEVPRAESPRADQRERAYEPEQEKRRGWLRPTLAVLAVLALLWGIRSRNHSQTSVAVAPSLTNTISGGEVGPATRLVKLQLPNGAVLNVGAAGPEVRLVSFLNDPTQHVDETTWFVLDHMQFETNSAKLRPESNEQIRNIQEIVKAYPHATLEIGGYTDSTGNEAANMKLSRDRAESARMAIVRMGVSPARVKAEGFGSQHPLAPNSTETGRAQNRRIAVLVTKR
jgi:outer membrane protein OmpA-like peptidoglycan-associated protein